MTLSICRHHSVQQVDTAEAGPLLPSQMTAAEAYESITNGGANDLATVVQILDEHGPWCLIGGLAVNCYVEPVYTIDADIVVVSANLSAIAAQLKQNGFTIREFPHSLNAQRGGSQLNVQFTIDARYQAFLNGAAPASVLGLRVPIAQLEDLVRGKIWAWSDAQRRLSKRKKDELDLIRLLEAYPKLRELMPPEITALFDEA